MVQLLEAAQKWGVDSGLLCEVILGFNHEIITQPGEEQPPVWLEMLADPAYFPILAEKLSPEDQARRDELIASAAALREKMGPIEDRIALLKTQVDDDYDFRTFDEVVQDYTLAVREYSEAVVTAAVIDDHLEELLNDPKVIMAQWHQLAITSSGRVICLCQKFVAAAEDLEIQKAEWGTHFREMVAEFEHDLNPPPAEPTSITNSGTIPIRLNLGPMITPCVTDLAAPVKAGTCEHGCTGLARNLACPEHGLGGTENDSETPDDAGADVRRDADPAVEPSTVRDGVPDPFPLN